MAIYSYTVLCVILNILNQKVRVYYVFNFRTDGKPTLLLTGVKLIEPKFIIVVTICLWCIVHKIKLIRIRMDWINQNNWTNLVIGLHHLYRFS